MSRAFKNVSDGLCDSTEPDTEQKGRAQLPVNWRDVSKQIEKAPLFPQLELLSAEAHQVGRSGAPPSIWLQWNLCWAGTNKPNLVSNIISLEPNLISAPVF